MFYVQNKTTRQYTCYSKQKLIFLLCYIKSVFHTIKYIFWFKNISVSIGDDSSVLWYILIKLPLCKISKSRHYIKNLTF